MTTVGPRLCRALMLRGKSIARQGLGQRVLSQGLRSFASFPSLMISKDSISAQGSFAVQQREFLQPDAEAARELGLELKRKKIGVVAHFYMDAELQGTLVEAKKEWEHIFCADSLAMGFASIEMAKAGCEGIAVLGVDFMSESVKAYLNQNGFGDIPVFRMKEGHIGCSLAASAEAAEYEAYLRKGAKLENPLHVIYINTSLRTKADSHDIVPTITCTSSNVIQTILQAVAEQPTINILYGPDTYMGQNLDRYFRILMEQSDEHIATIHPAHNRDSIKRLVSQFHWFKQGICTVHHMFGAEVTQNVMKEYPLTNKENFYTAHFEVPGEMFELATEANLQGRGVFGSTSGILNFITGEAKKPFDGYSKKTFLLGTEAGMITGIVKDVQDVLKAKGADCKDKVEIVFPVSAEAVAQTGEEYIPLVPGVQGGEGCSTAGGCATCPFMKMNDLDSLTDLVNELPSSGLQSIPPSLASKLATVPEGGLTKNENPITDGTKPIQYMREFMEKGVYSSSLMDRVMGMGGEKSQRKQVRAQLSSDPLRVGLVGLGAVGTVVAEALESGRVPNASLVAALDELPRPDIAVATSELEDFLAADWSVCVEAAGQGWIRDNAVRVLSTGRSLIITSVGAFTDDDLFAACRDAAENSGGKLLIVSGALPGMDWMASAVLDETLQEVTVSQRKQPEGWRGTPADDRVDLSAVTEPTKVFEGPARVAAAEFPKNANIAAALALATVGLDNTKVTLWADPSVTGPTNTVFFRGRSGELSITVKGGKPLSPKTSRIVPYSVLKALNNLSAPVFFGI